MAALDAAHVAARAHVLASEAGGVRDIAAGQGGRVEGLVAMEPHELRLRGGNEPHVVVLVAIQVLVEVRKVRASYERLATRHERRIDLGETSGDLEVDNPCDERALQRRASAAQDIKT